jgi:thiosulfate/3-mercaptopyruvate sulfurtransferase
VIAPVVTAQWYARNSADVVVADVRWYLDGRSGRAAYDAGHVPGAVFVDLEQCLVANGSPDAGRHPLPEPAAFADAMAALGIGENDTVLAYDDAGGGVIAARLVWMLRASGHDAALLDGGIGAYSGPLEQATPPRSPAEFGARPWPAALLADIDDAASPGYTVIDARDADRYRGDHEPVDPRAGHIPGAHNLPCRENLSADGRFLPPEQLRQRFLDVGVSDATPVVSYCGSGITACHNLLALELAGLGGGRLYPGSWSQYSNDERREIAVEA